MVDVAIASFKCMSHTPLGGGGGGLETNTDYKTDKYVGKWKTRTQTWTAQTIGKGCHVAVSVAGADPGFVNRGFVINARNARGKFFGGHAYF